jgi:hypothetical protein
VGRTLDHGHTFSRHSGAELTGTLTMPDEHHDGLLAPDEIAKLDPVAVLVDDV